MTHMVHIEIDDQNLPVPTPEIEERRVAMDLLEQNNFVLPAASATLRPGRIACVFQLKKTLGFDVALKRR